MTYYVIGLMSGSSLDGLDIIHTSITYATGKWEYEINHADCIPFSEEWKERLKHAHTSTIPEFLNLHTDFGQYLAEQINDFKEKYNLLHKIHFIASHGHTVFHDPANQTTFQIGDGATIAAQTGYTTISDLRNMDIALGGQGAPIVPIADRILFKTYDYCLNIGGISNVTINREEPIAFDICPANQIFNALAQKAGQPFDDEGALAAKGQINEQLLDQLNALDYYQIEAPKSLDNRYSEDNILTLLSEYSPEDALATAVAHVSHQVVNSIKAYFNNQSEKMLCTGGGAFNKFLIESIQKELKENQLDIEVVVPDNELIEFKEALAMALIGVLRWREEENVLSSVTGASRNSIGGALWLGA